MKTAYKYIFSCAAAALLIAACNPKMDAPTPGSVNDPTRPDAPPQVIFMPEGVEAHDLTVYGDYLYVTAPQKDWVYRFHIADLNNLSLVGNAVPYVKVPGAKGIVADDWGGLYIGSSSAGSPASAGFSPNPPYGPVTGQWESDQVIYFTHTSDDWHTKFEQNPAQKLFVAPRGNFNALAWYKGTGSTNKRYEDGLYFAASNNVWGMGINSKRYTESLKTVSGLIPENLDFLIKLALGEFNMDELNLNDIIAAVNMLGVDLDIKESDLTTGTAGYVNLALNNFDKFVMPGFDGTPINLQVRIPLHDMLKFVDGEWGSTAYQAALIAAQTAWGIYKGNSPLSVGITVGAAAVAGTLSTCQYNFVDIDLPAFGALSLEPRWGLDLVTLWMSDPLEIERQFVIDMLDDLLGGNEGFKQMISDALYPIFGSDNSIWVYIADALSSVASYTLENPSNISKLLTDYTTTGDKLSLNGNYKDQPGDHPPRPYILPYDKAGSAIDESRFSGSPWKWNVTNLSALSPRPTFLGYPMSLNFDTEVINGSNVKIALTLYLLQFKNGTNPSISLIEGQEQVDKFVAALGTGSILDKIKNVVGAINIDLLLADNAILDNDQLQAYLQFVKKLADSPDTDVMLLLGDLFELIENMGITVDFNELLNAWVSLPDWAEIGGTRVGWIANHDMFGGLYESLDSYVDGTNGLWGSIMHWVSSKIPRINTAIGWSYDAPSNPTGIAFGFDNTAQGVVGWVVDNKRLYTNINGVPSYSKPVAGSVIREDYPWKNEDGTEPYMLNGVAYSKPNAAYWTPNALDRYRWSRSALPGSGQDKTVVPKSAVLDNCYGVIYDDNNGNPRVLVSCNDGPASSNKGRIVAVQYRNLSASSPQTLVGSGFFPPPPRLQLADYTYDLRTADINVWEFIPADGELDQPKGMAIKDKYLFIADGNRIVVYYMGHKE